MLAPSQYPSLAMLKWVSMTPFGNPVVPEVYCIMVTSWTSTESFLSWYSSSETWQARDLTSFMEYMPRYFSGPRWTTLLRWGYFSLWKLSLGWVFSSGMRS